MNTLLPTLNQIAFLFGFIIIGYILSKGKFLPDNTSEVLSKLENMIFVPSLVMGTFITNFTLDTIKSMDSLLLISGLIAIIMAFVSIVVSRLVTRDKYIQKIYTYGLSFSNFGFMGNAVVSSLFPDIFLEYLIFTLPLWVLIYLWGVPRLLISGEEKKSLKQSLKSFVNPMFIAMIIGMIIGISGVKLPKFLTSIVKVSGDCMSPVAMILTGVVVAKTPIKKVFSNISVYVVTLIRLIVIPLVFIFLSSFFKMSDTIFICALCTLSMPLGLNTIVIPSAYGKDTTVAASMAVISHLIAVITIPFIFTFIK